MVETVQIKYFKSYCMSNAEIQYLSKRNNYCTTTIILSIIAFLAIHDSRTRDLEYPNINYMIQHFSFIKSYNWR